MAAIIWTGAAKNGNWDDPLNWSIGGQPAGRIPGSGDDVDMGSLPHLPFPTLSSSAAVSSLVVDETTFVTSGATLNVAGSISVVATFVDMSFNVAGTAQAGAITNLDANGLLSGGQRAHFVIEAGGTFIDRDTPGAASPIDTLLTNVSLGAGSKFEVSDGVSLIDITASLSNVSGTATLTNELTLNAHNAPFLNPINVISNGLITLVNDDFRAAELFIDASSIVGGTGSITVVSQSITNNGQIWSESQGTSSLVIASDVTGTGTARLFDGSTLEFTGAVASSETINFDAPENGEKLIIDAVNASGFAATLHGFTTLDAIDLTHTAAKSATIDGSDLLALRDANGVTVANLQMTGDYTGKTFLVSGDGGTGSLVTVFTNESPVTTAPASEIASTNTSLAFAGANQISVPDAFIGAGENITVVLTDTTGLLSAVVSGSGGGASIIGSGTQHLTISGGLGQVNAALSTLSFLSNSVGIDQIDVATSDGRGGIDDHKIAINVVANQPPVTTAPTTEIASVNSPLAFSGVNQISVADPDAASGTGENITVVLTDAAGLLSAVVSGSGSGASITGSGTPHLTISGSLGQVNTALSTLSFLGNAVGADQIDVATSDGRGGNDDHKIAVSVVANQPPVTTAPATELVSKGTPLAFTGANQISVVDPDALSGTGENITVVLTDISGLLSTFVPGSGGGAVITGSGTQQLTISGGLGQVNAALANLSFLGNTLGVDQIDVATSDGRGGSDDHKIAVSVVANQPPVTTVPTSEIVSKGASFAFSGGNQISVADPDAQTPPGENITVVLTDTAGLLSAFVPGSGGGAIITGSGTQQLTISGGLNQVNTALASLSLLSNTAGPDQIDVATSDGRGGSDDHKIAMTVTPSSNVPFSIIAPSAATLGVNQPGSLGNISLAESPTSPGETFSIVISDVNGALSATMLVAGGGGTIVHSGANTLTISGTLDQVNADLTTLTDTAPSTAPDSIFMLANTSNGGSAIALMDLAVNGVPTITTPSVVPAPAGLATLVSGLKVSETGNTAGEFFVVQLSDANGLLSATSGGSLVIGSGTKQLTLSGSLDEVNAQLVSLTITETALGPDVINGQVGDGFGNASNLFSILVIGEKAWTSNIASDPNNWNNAANWTTPGSPVAGQDFFVPAAGLQPVIFDGASGTIGGTVTNNGTISLASTGAQTTLLVNGTAALEGIGSVILSDSASNVIEASGNVDSILDNRQTIEGAGSIAVDPGFNSAVMTFHNDATGIVNATDSNALVFITRNFVPGLVINDGLIEASGAGGLFLDSVRITNNGTIAANNGSHIDLDAIISGGTLSTIGTGVIRLISTSGILVPTLNGASNGPLTNLGRIEINGGNSLTISGTINNNGTINLLGGATQSVALFIDQNTTLQGSGSVALSDSASNVIEASGTADSILDNRQTIEGAGSIAVDPGFNSAVMTFHNDATGIVNATGSNALVFITHNFVPGLVINDGLIEASGAGGLFLDSVRITNNGTIEANNGSHIDLDAIISGGTLNTTGTGVIRSISTSGILVPTLNGASNGPLTNLGRIEVDGGNSLTISGTINNNGTIHLLGDATQSAALLIDQNTTLQGTGSVVLSDSASNVIEASGTADSILDNRQTIEGAGSIAVDPGFNSAVMTFHNDATGIVNATDSNALVFITRNFVPGLVINDGLIEASGAGGLFLESVRITNNGTIAANNGSHIDLDAIISGGTLSTIGTGVIRLISTSGILVRTLNGASNGPLTNLGRIEINGGNSLTISGTINNNGTINLLGGATQSVALFIDQNTTLQGSGSVALSDSASNVIEASGTADSILDNRQTIEGAGSIAVDPGFNSAVMTFHNDATGIVNATGSNALVFITHNFVPGLVINDGLIEASGAGGLFLDSVRITNNGTIEANNGSHIDLDAIISGGTLNTTGTGVIRSISTSGILVPTLNGASNGPLTNLGKIEIDGGNSLTIFGAINNNGTINLLGNATQTATLLIDQNTTLQGSGSLSLSDSASNLIESDLFDSILDNRQTISGAGSIALAPVGSPSLAALTFHNDTTGIVNATGSNALAFVTHDIAPGLVTNDGVMEASGSGGLVFDHVSVTNRGGLIEADAGSHVDFVDSQLSGTGGLFFIDPNATATFSNASAASDQIIQFRTGTNETLVLDDATINSTTIGAHISGFAIGDRIDLAQLKVTSATIDGSARVHLLSGTTEIGSLQLDSSNLGERFVVTSDGGAGTLLTVGVSTPPQVTESLVNDTGTKANDGITNDASLAGTGDDFAVVSFSEGGSNLGTTVADASGAWHFTPTGLAQGSHIIIASETNAAGTGHASLAFTYDTLAPSVAITTPDALVANPLLTLTGTGEAGTQLQLFDNNVSTGGLVTVDATGHWSEQITLVGAGTHLIAAAATDLAGNLGSSAVSTFALDNQIFAPINQLNVVGTTGPDHITISQSNILVSAGTGNDTITLTPGGNFQFHFLNGGPGNDTLDLSQIAGNVTANLAQDTLVGSQVGFSVLNSIENIIAGTGNERLIGSSGANAFQAGAGTDTLTGNGGGDTFVFKAGFGKAVVTDFHVATTRANPHDVIELDHSLFAQFATVQALLASAEVTQSGSSVVIAADATHTIELQHTSLRTLLAHANDVLFV